MVAGTKVSISDLNALYSRIYNLKTTHKNSTYQKNASAITISLPSTSGIAVGDTVKTSTANFQLLKNELANLANSKWYTPNSSGETYTYMTDYSTTINVPNVGDLLKASDFNLLDTAITNAEKVSISYSSHYSSRYGTNYGSQYGTNYGGQYGSNYSARYGSNYSAQYGSCYSSRYGSQYGSNYSARYGSCYSAKYGAQYLNRC